MCDVLYKVIQDTFGHCI